MKRKKKKKGLGEGFNTKKGGVREMRSHISLQNRYRDGNGLIFMRRNENGLARDAEKRAANGWSGMAVWPSPHDHTDPRTAVLPPHLGGWCA